MADKLKLGLVGAHAAGRGWGPAAHIPALRVIEAKPSGSATSVM
jgi:hypothetical protein